MNAFLSYGLLIPFGIVIYLLWRPWYVKFPKWQDAFPAVILIGTPLTLIMCHVIYFYTPGTFHSDFQNFFFTFDGWRAGYSSVGLLIGAVLTVLIASVIHHLPTIELLDLYSPAAFVASAVWRVGCFVHGCCYGAPTSVPWAVRFTLSSELGIKTPPCHPVQLYEVLFSIVVLLILPFAIRKNDIHPGKGVILGVCLMVYSLERFILEFFRIGGTSTRIALGMSATQLFALAVIIAVMVTSAFLLNLKSNLKS